MSERGGNIYRCKQQVIDFSTARKSQFNITRSPIRIDAILGNFSSPFEKVILDDDGRFFLGFVFKTAHEVDEETSPSLRFLLHCKQRNMLMEKTEGCFKENLKPFREEIFPALYIYAVEESLSNENVYSFKGFNNYFFPTYAESKESSSSSSLMLVALNLTFLF